MDIQIDDKGNIQLADGFGGAIAVRRDGITISSPSVDIVSPVPISFKVKFEFPETYGDRVRRWNEVHSF